MRFLPLTATRRSEAAEMTRGELAGGDWIIPAARMKAKLEHVVPLSPAARAIIDSMPNLGKFVFTHGGHKPFTGFHIHKPHLDRLSGINGWRLHDLRRSARSLMSRAGVDSDIAERCLAHTIGGIRGVYDRHGTVISPHAAPALVSEELRQGRGSVRPLAKILRFATPAGEKHGSLVIYEAYERYNCFGPQAMAAYFAHPRARPDPVTIDGRNFWERTCGSAMTKRPKLRPATRLSWDIYLVLHSPAKWIGTVEAVDKNAAIGEAAELFKPNDPGTLIAVQRR